MKKLLFLSMLISAASGFISAAGFDNFTLDKEAEAFDLLKIGIERIAYKRPGGLITREEVEKILDKELKVLECFENIKDFQREIENGKWNLANNWKKNFSIVPVAVLSAGFVSKKILTSVNFFRSEPKLQQYPGIITVILGSFLGIGCATLIIPDRYLPATMIQKKRLEKELQKAKAESQNILDPEKFCESSDGFSCVMNLRRATPKFAMLLTSADDLDFGVFGCPRKQVGQSLFKALHSQDPDEYPNLDSLKISSKKFKEIEAMQAFVADATNATKESRRRNVSLAVTVATILNRLHQ